MEIVLEDKRLRLEKASLGPFGTNAYLVVCRETGESLLIDAPADAERISRWLDKTVPRGILLTHNHPDHIGALAELRSCLRIPLAAHAADGQKFSPPPERLLQDGDIVNCGRLRLRTIHTPGHTPGSLCFYLEGVLLAGDTLFPGGPGRTASPEDFRHIVSSITEKCFILPDETLVLPGHGDATTIGREKKNYAVFAARRHPAELCGDVLWLDS